MSDSITDIIGAESSRIGVRLYEARVGNTLSDPDLDILMTAADDILSLHALLVTGGIHRVLWASEPAQ